MEEKKLTPQESMEVITQMINASKENIAQPDTRISEMWAELSVVTAAVVLILKMMTHNPACSYLWLAIPLIGFPLNYLIGRKKSRRGNAKTYVQSVIDGIWRIVGYVAIMLTAICLIYNLFGYPQVWISMFYFAFIVVGFGAAATGVVLREKIYVFGGIFSMIAGLITAVCPLCGTSLLDTWAIPLYILCFILMFILPAIVIRHKLKKAAK